MKYLWIPSLCVLSILLTSYMLVEGFSDWTIFLTSLSVGGTLGYISGKIGYEA